MWPTTAIQACPSREEDLLLAQVQACTHCVTSTPLGPVLLPYTCCMELMAIITMIAIAALLPPRSKQQSEQVGRSKVSRDAGIY